MVSRSPSSRSTVDIAICALRGNVSQSLLPFNFGEVGDPVEMASSSSEHSSDHGPRGWSAYAPNSQRNPGLLGLELIMCSGEYHGFRGEHHHSTLPNLGISYFHAAPAQRAKASHGLFKVTLYCICIERTPSRP